MNLVMATHPSDLRRLGYGPQCPAACDYGRTDMNESRAGDLSIQMFRTSANKRPTRNPTRLCDSGVSRLLKNPPRSFRGAAKRRARNPEKQEIPMFWIPGSRLSL